MKSHSSVADKQEEIVLPFLESRILRSGTYGMPRVGGCLWGWGCGLWSVFLNKRQHVITTLKGPGLPSIFKYHIQKVTISFY